MGSEQYCSCHSNSGLYAVACRKENKEIVYTNVKTRESTESTDHIYNPIAKKFSPQYNAFQIKKKEKTHLAFKCDHPIATTLVSPLDLQASNPAVVIQGFFFAITAMYLHITAITTVNSCSTSDLA